MARHSVAGNFLGEPAFHNVAKLRGVAARKDQPIAIRLFRSRRSFILRRKTAQIMRMTVSFSLRLSMALIR